MEDNREEIKNKKLKSIHDIKSTRGGITIEERLMVGERNRLVLEKMFNIKSIRKNLNFNY